MTPAHATQPQLCAECLAEAESMAECGNGAHVVKACERHRTIGIGFTAGGAITSWDLRGPLPGAALQGMLAVGVATLEQQGAMARPITSN